MQMISQRTSMKYFSIALLVTTISTVLGVIFLTGTLHRMQRNFGKAAMNFICKHLYFVENKLLNPLPKESRTRRAKNFSHLEKKIEERAVGNLWKYVCFTAEICFVIIPVIEINSALRFYGSPDHQKNATNEELHRRTPQTHLCGIELATILKSDQGGSEIRSKCRAQQVREVKLAKVIESRNTPRHNIMSKVLTVLLITVRVLLLSIWIPLVIFEYTILLLALPLIRRNEKVKPSGGSRTTSKRETLALFFTAPLAYLGLNIYQLQAQELLHDAENPQATPQATPQFAHIERCDSSTSLSGRTVTDHTPRSYFEPSMQASQQLRHVVSQSAFQQYQEQHTTNWSGTATPSPAETPPIGSVQVRKRGYSDRGIAYRLNARFA
jgi:hypothetical protein